MRAYKVCTICKQKIIEELDKWVKVTDFDGKIIFGEVYYHLECWKNNFLIDNQEKLHRDILKNIRSIRNDLS